MQWILFCHKKKKKSWHVWQHGWTLRAWWYVNWSRQRECCGITYTGIWKKHKSHFIETDTGWWLPGAEVWRKWGDGRQRVKCFSYVVWISTGDLRHNIVTIVNHTILYTRGDPKKGIYKNLCIHSYMFKRQSPSKYSPFDVTQLSRLFFPLLKTVFELLYFDAF